MAPGNLRNSLLRKFGLGISLFQGLHVLKVAIGESPHSWEFHSQIDGEPVDDLPAPSVAFLAVEDQDGERKPSQTVSAAIRRYWW